MGASPRNHGPDIQWSGIVTDGAVGGVCLAAGIRVHGAGEGNWLR